MSQSLVKNYIHLVFSTKYRTPIMDIEIQKRMFEYMNKICQNLNSPLIIAGGTDDHVHLLLLLSKNITLAKLVEEIKKSTSKWIKTQGEKYELFYWQGGYGAFSVNPKQLDRVKFYISNQREHHKKTNFVDEYTSILKKYEIEYNEKYLFD